MHIWRHLIIVLLVLSIPTVSVAAYGENDYCHHSSELSDFPVINETESHCHQSSEHDIDEKPATSNQHDCQCYHYIECSGSGYVFVSILDKDKEWPIDIHHNNTSYVVNSLYSVKPYPWLRPPISDF